MITVVDVDVPGAPEGADMTNMTKASRKLTWNPPVDDGGSKVTGYYVEAFNGFTWDKIYATSAETSSPLAPVLTTSMHGKRPKLNVRVYAENAVGAGQPLEMTFKVYDVPGCPGMYHGVLRCALVSGDVPGCPEAPTLCRISAHDVLLRFAPPDDGGSPIMSYIVEVKRSEDTQWKPAGGRLYLTKSQFLATGLQTSIEYEFRVTAVNDAGPGPPSATATLARCGNTSLVHA